ncbi:MAG: sulfatase/phosphatase domain-containing protein [Planctomycetota bacterium]
MVWGDHGFLLGEYNFWGKHNTMDLSVRTPLIIRAPGAAPRRVEQLVEFVDLYPTLAEMAGLAVPDHGHGKSFVPVFDDPEAAHKDALHIVWCDSLAVKTEDFFIPSGATGRACCMTIASIPTRTRMSPGKRPMPKRW